jgi:poly-gamma-glutamate synthesis protein (capsule biosynthesis protein)
LRADRKILRFLKGLGLILEGLGLTLLLASCALAREPSGQGQEKEKSLRLLFVGDVMAHKEQIEGARRPGEENEWDFAPQFRRVKPLFRLEKSDIDGVFVVGNLETVFAGEKRGFAGYPSFNTPDALADALADLGADVLTLANNHILDRGFSGAKRTTEVLNRAGILWTGLAFGEEGALTADAAGLKIAFVNYSYGSNRAPVSGDVFPNAKLNTISDAAVTEGLSQARLSSPDLVVACFHWGNEYQAAPTKRQRALAVLAAENGADLVIGTHPHVLQPVEVFVSGGRPRLAAYSLGNFVSYQRTPPRDRSVVLAVDVKKILKHTEQTKQTERTEYAGDIKARLVRVSVAPTWVAARRARGRHLIEVVYAGESARFNHAGLPAKELESARAAGKSVLEFLGATESADAEGFYTLWDERGPE